MRRELFAQAGGLDAAYLSGLAGVDLCLRLRAQGVRVAEARKAAQAVSKA